MSSTYRYQIPVEQTQWKFEGQSETILTWEYEDGRSKLLALYDKGKKQQWDAATRIDWSQDLDPENPMMLDDRAVQIWGSPVWERLTDKERVRVRFNQREVWETLGLPVEECIQATLQSDQMKQFRTRLFTRIVPTVKDIGLWGQRVQKAYADMGVLDFATIDAEALLDNDAKVAEEFDARRVR